MLELDESVVDFCCLTCSICPVTATLLQLVGHHGMRESLTVDWSILKFSSYFEPYTSVVILCPHLFTDFHFIFSCFESYLKYNRI